MPDYARACRPPDYAPNYAIMPSIMARALMSSPEQRQMVAPVEGPLAGPVRPPLLEGGIDKGRQKLAPTRAAATCTLLGRRPTSEPRQSLPSEPRQPLPSQPHWP